MNTLITPQQALQLAFGAGEQHAAAEITPADIAAAEARYIAPVIGPTLYQALIAGGHTAFTTDYLAPAVARFTRLIIQPRLDLRTGAAGSTEPYSQYARPAGDQSRRALRRSLLTQGRTLLRRAEEYLIANPGTFPEYTPQEAVANRCRIDGGLVQSR